MIVYISWNMLEVDLFCNFMLVISMYVIDLLEFNRSQAES